MPGEQNANADGLSRQAWEDEVEGPDILQGRGGGGGGSVEDYRDLQQ